MSRSKQLGCNGETGWIWSCKYSPFIRAQARSERGMCPREAAPDNQLLSPDFQLSSPGSKTAEQADSLLEKLMSLAVMQLAFNKCRANKQPSSVTSNRTFSSICNDLVYFQIKSIAAVRVALTYKTLPCYLRAHCHIGGKVHNTLVCKISVWHVGGVIRDQSPRLENSHPQSVNMIPSELQSLIRRWRPQLGHRTASC